MTEQTAKNRVFRRTVELPASAEEAFLWHRHAGLQRLLPPWEGVAVEQAPEGLEDGQIAKLLVPTGLWKTRWVAEHYDCEWGRQFCDRQTSGPFAFWEHCHRFQPSDNGCLLEDSIEFRLPGGTVGNLLAGSWVENQLERMFRFRHDVTRADLAAHHPYRGRQMKIAVTGSSGLVGQQLEAFLQGGGHEVTRVVRRPPREGEIQWDPEIGKLNADDLEGIDAVIHLAGESIAEGRWDDAKKRRIIESRVQPTKLLCETIAKMDNPPQTLVSASAIGYYGDRGEEELDESSAAGEGYLPEVCEAWEAATQTAKDAGIRVVNGRIGVVLTPRGGALKKMLLPFKLGGGGVVGSGKQYWSWISLDDLVGALQHCVMTESLSGAVNLVAPEAVTNREFTKALGRVLGRPTILPLPAFAARIVLGEMADALLLASARVAPRQLLDSGYEFRHATVEEALRHVLGRAPQAAKVE